MKLSEWRELYKNKKHEYNMEMAHRNYQRINRIVYDVIKKRSVRERIMKNVSGLRKFSLDVGFVIGAG